MNYRHNTPAAVTSSAADDALSGVEWLGEEERTNYPLTLSVEDFGEALGLTAQVAEGISADRVCGYMQRTLEQVAEALEQALNTPVRELDVLPADERAYLLEELNRTAAPYPSEQCIHELFEAQVRQAPEAVAVVYQDQRLSYGELNARANKLAHHLIALGVRPDQPVAICVARSVAMVVGDPQGGRGVPAAGPGLSTGAAAAGSRRCGAAAPAGRCGRAIGAGRRCATRSDGGGSGGDAGMGKSAGVGSGPACARPDLAPSRLCDLHLGINRFAQGGTE